MNNHYKENTNLLGLNNNLLCAIDMIVTGYNARKDSMIQICILPLDAELYPMKHGIVPFFTDLKPLRPENIDLSKHHVNHRATKERICRANKLGMHSFDAADRFGEWFERFEFKWKKNIQCLTYNWVHKRDFLIEWLGIEHFNSYFSPYYRDPLPVAMFVNDRAEFAVENYPFAKVYQVYLMSQTKTEHTRNMDTLQGCLTLADLYRRMVFKLY